MCDIIEITIIWCKWKGKNIFRARKTKSFLLYLLQLYW